ncbi:hypothetical protein [Sphingopyxis sp. BSNA05]|uniref:hypothetical protein n=1 Tax=Sphingopyxis sp. BSNA05 TaxID=1236614 RepID=UPI0020B70EDC|nr:hypothetical protein [Sphingopyxis sp. BSNA05]
MSATVVTALVVASPASAQFGGLFKKPPATSGTPDTKAGGDDCASNPKGAIGRSILGNMIGDFTRRATQNMGVAGTYIPRAEVADTLTNSIACRLDLTSSCRPRKRRAA